MNRHIETFMQLNELCTHYPAYQPTFDFTGDFITSTHGWLATRPMKKGLHIQIQPKRSWRWALAVLTRDALTRLRNVVRFGSAIPGWLMRADALKLYEMAYFSRADILELGSYYGLSTCILAQANQDSPVAKALYTVDIDPAFSIATLQTLRQMGLVQGVTVMCSDSVAALQKFAADGKQFGCIFIDHSHAYEQVRAVCRELAPVVAPGGFCVFHDFNNPYNRDAANEDYGVYQAVSDGLDPTAFEFYGIYGCSGLYRAV